MKRNRALPIVFIMIIITLAFSFAGCKKSSSAVVDGTETSGAASESSAGETSSELKTFTRDELAKYTGKDGTRAYIAIDGKVYDVTDVSQWKNGSHANGKFEAGKDFTEELKNLAPHDSSKLDGVPVVGTLVN